MSFQVVIANYECDSEANRPLAEKMGIQSFPTIKFYPKGTDKTAIVRIIHKFQGRVTINAYIFSFMKKAAVKKTLSSG